MLSTEEWLEVCKFVPYNDLNFQIRYVNFMFSELVPLVIEKLYPRSYRHVWVRWDREENCHFLGILSTVELPFKELSMQRGLPQCALPPNIHYIQRIHISGPITRELLGFLSVIKEKVKKCKVDFDDIDKFMEELKRSKVGTETFFSGLPRACLKIYLDGHNSEFLTSKYALQCPKLYIMQSNYGFNHQSLAKWLFNTHPNRRILEVLHSYYPRVVKKFCRILQKMMTKSNERTANCNFEVNFIRTNIRIDELMQFAVPGKLSITMGYGIAIMGGKANSECPENQYEFDMVECYETEIDELDGNVTIFDLNNNDGEEEI